MKNLDEDSIKHSFQLIDQESTTNQTFDYRTSFYQQQSYRLAFQDSQLNLMHWGVNHNIITSASLPKIQQPRTYRVSRCRNRQALNKQDQSAILMPRYAKIVPMNHVAISFQIKINQYGLPRSKLRKSLQLIQSLQFPSNGSPKRINSTSNANRSAQSPSNSSLSPVNKKSNSKLIKLLRKSDRNSSPPKGYF